MICVPRAVREKKTTTGVLVSITGREPKRTPREREGTKYKKLVKSEQHWRPYLYVSGDFAKETMKKMVQMLLN